MEVYVLDSSYNKLGIIDDASSVIWTVRYCAVGDSELYVPVSVKAINLLKIGNILMRADDPTTLMIIQSLHITTDEDNGDYITARCESVESLIGRRIVWAQTNLSGLVTDVVAQLLSENLISPYIANRTITGISLGSSCSCDVSITKQITGDNLLDAIIEILSAYNLGFMMVFNGSGLVFHIYSGVDRSLDQTENPHVTFSTEFDNLISSEYAADISEYKNVALVAGEGEGIARKTYVVGSASGIDRIETFVDAKDISSEVEGGTLTPDQYNGLLAEKGSESLSETLAVQSFSGTIEPEVNYKYRVDYDLGDIVQITNEYDISAPARIIEVIESWDENGYSCIPTFSSEEV